MSEAIIAWYQIDLDAPQDTTVLDTDEHARAARLRDPVRASRWATGRAALRTILARTVGGSPAVIDFCYGPHGKPALVAYPGIEFNIAHSGPLMVCAVSTLPVGIDCEWLDRSGARDLLRFLAPEEQQIVCALPVAERSAAILSIWVQKEALLKARGTGLTVPLASFAVCCTPPGLLRWPDATPWQICRWQPAPGAVAAIAAPAPFALVQHEL